MRFIITHLLDLVGRKSLEPKLELKIFTVRHAPGKPKICRYLQCEKAEGWRDLVRRLCRESPSEFQTSRPQERYGDLPRITFFTPGPAGLKTRQVITFAILNALTFRDRLRTGPVETFLLIKLNRYSKEVVLSKKRTTLNGTALSSNAVFSELTADHGMHP